MSRRRLGVYGGTFDPIHRGHVEPILAARRALALDRVLYVPTGSPPHRDGPIAPALARWTMVELALLPYRELVASPIELRDDRPSYTVATLERLAAEDPAADLVLLVGADAFAGMGSWRQGERLPELAEVGVLTRPGTSWDDLVAALPAALRAAVDCGRVARGDHEPVAVSATAVREKLAAGDPTVAEDLAPLVLDYLRKHGDYRRRDSSRGSRSRTDLGSE
jgi:nicotinate-nucleotide adenylyltransferase